MKKYTSGFDFSNNEKGFSRKIKYKNGNIERIVCDNLEDMQIKCKEIEDRKQWGAMGTIKQIIGNKNNLNSIDIKDLVDFISDNMFFGYDTYLDRITDDEYDISVADLIDFIVNYDNKGVL